MDPSPQTGLGRSFLVAHRAGNDHPTLLGASRYPSVALVEADVRLFRNRAEVRHLKTLGPLPLLWDRWELAAPWRKRMTLGELLDATPGDVELLLDLKGRSPRLARLVAAQVGPLVPARRFSVCARSWRMLDAFAGLPVRRFYSVGSRRQLRRLLRQRAGVCVEGLCVNERLVDLESMTALSRIADVVLTWPVNHLDRAAELLALGVRGLITDDVALLSRPGALELT